MLGEEGEARQDKTNNLVHTICIFLPYFRGSSEFAVIARSKHFYHAVTVIQLSVSIFQLSLTVFSVCTVWYHEIQITLQIFALFYFFLNFKIKVFSISPCTSV